MLINNHKLLTEEYCHRSNMTETIDYKTLCHQISNNKGNLSMINKAIIEFWNGLPFTIDMFLEARTLMEAKNHDYAKATDPFSNFRLCSEVGLCSVVTGILVRLGDKVSRFHNLNVVQAKVLNESQRDTMLDIINYCVIIYTYLETQK